MLGGGWAIVMREDDTIGLVPHFPQRAIDPCLRLVPWIPIVRVDIPQHRAMTEFPRQADNPVVTSSERRSEPLLAAAMFRDQLVSGLDLTQNLGVAQLSQSAMGERVVGDQMSGFEYPTQRGRMGGDLVADDKERGLDSVVIENPQYTLAVHRVRPIIQGQPHVLWRLPIGRPSSCQRKRQIGHGVHPNRSKRMAPGVMAGINTGRR